MIIGFIDIRKKLKNKDYRPAWINKNSWTHFQVFTLYFRNLLN